MADFVKNEKAAKHYNKSWTMSCLRCMLIYYKEQDVKNRM